MSEPMFVTGQKDVLDKLQEHIDALTALKEKVASAPEDGPESIQMMFLSASATRNDAEIDVRIGTSFDPLSMGQVLSCAAIMSPDIVLGLMEGLASNDATREAVTASIVAMMEAMDECEELAVAKPEGNA